jgi:hypothetical protein
MSPDQTWFDCFTSIKPDGKVSVSSECQRRQIASLQSTVERMGAALLECRDLTQSGDCDSLAETVRSVFNITTKALIGKP